MKHIHSTILSALILSLAAAQVATAETVSKPQEYFPMKAGTVERFRVNKNWTATYLKDKPKKKQSYIAKIIIESVKVVEGQSQFKIIVRHQNDDGSVSYINKRSTRFINDKGLYEISSGGKQQQLVAFPITLNKKLKSKVESSKILGKEIKSYETNHYSIESVTLSNGKVYKDCLKIDSALYINGKLTMSQDQWFARNLGRVKEITKLKSDMNNIMVYERLSGSEQHHEKKPEPKKDVTPAVKTVERPEEFFNVSKSLVGTATVKAKYFGKSEVVEYKVELTKAEKQGKSGHEFILTELRSKQKQNKGFFYCDRDGSKKRADGEDSVLEVFPLQLNKVLTSKTKEGQLRTKEYTLVKTVPGLGAQTDPVLKVEEYLYNNNAQGERVLVHHGVKYCKRHVGVIYSVFKTPTGQAIMSFDFSKAPGAKKKTALTAFCPGCGRKFHEDDKFCGGCGKKRS